MDEVTTATTTDTEIEKPNVSFNYTHILKLIVALVLLSAGFIAGHLVTKDRYIEKITQISKMNMEKAVAIDSMQVQLNVLGAKTEAYK